MKELGVDFRRKSILTLPINTLPQCDIFLIKLWTLFYNNYILKKNLTIKQKMLILLMLLKLPKGLNSYCILLPIFLQNIDRR